MGVTTALSRLAARLDTFVESAAALWHDYQAQGPGRLSKSVYEPVQSAARALDQTLRDADVIASLQQVADINANQISGIANQLDKLARSCACTPQGLSFITGEAGLIPRRDQHEALESHLTELREIARRLTPQC